MTRGRHAVLLPLATLAALACALIGASAWLPAAASAAGSAGATGQSAAGLVAPAPPVLSDLLGRGPGASAAELPFGLGALPGARETAAFAAGRVAVGVVFLESNGKKMKSTENWSDTRRALVVAKIQSALDWWNARSPDGSLELFMPAAGAYGAPRTLATGYEPINRPIEYGYGGRAKVLSDAAWRWEAMGRLGFAHDARDDKPYPETLYADKIRRQNDADWAFVLYVVDSLHDKDGAFAKDANGNRAIAYTADLFGPYSVLTYDNDGYGFANFGAVLAHEMGHVFGALDEYAPPSPGYPSTGNLTSGYLGVRNGNAVSGGTTDLPCIMRGSQQTLDAFAYGYLCRWTKGQTGLRDGDADTHPDVVDTRPALATALESTAVDGSVTLRGTVAERPRHRGRISIRVYFHHDLSIFVPHALQYQVDGGGWQPLTATDGSFGEPAEGWTLTTDALTPGRHVLKLQGTTGQTAGRTRNLWAGPTAVTLGLATNAAFTRTKLTVAAGATAHVYVRSTSGVLPVARLTPIRLIRLADHQVVARLTTGEKGVWTGTLKPTTTSAYEVRFAGIPGQFPGPVTSGRVTITVQ